MTKLFWIDLEMTGLDVEKEVIIEAGAIVTDLELRELESYHAVVRQPHSLLAAMDDWNQKHHKESGLLDLIPNGKSPEIVETELLQLLERHFATEPAVIAGNSIGQDRLFLNRYFKRFAARLHYRMLDVTSWKIMMNAKFNVKYDKLNAHRAVDDIKESISEMKHYLNQVKPEQ